MRSSLRVRPFLAMRHPRLLLLALALWVPARPISYIREVPKRGATLISALQCATATTQRKNSSLHFELQKVMFAQRAWLPRAQSTALLQFGLSQERDMSTFSEVCASAAGVERVNLGASEGLLYGVLPSTAREPARMLAWPQCIQCGAAAWIAANWRMPAVALGSPEPPLCAPLG
jgi:hypothetical protein